MADPCKASVLAGLIELNTRKLAATALNRVVTEGKSLTAALDEILPSIPLDIDRGFVQALCYGVVRWYFRLDSLLRELVAKPIRDPEVRLLVLVGLYQLEYTRVKPHAAVAETVSALGTKTWAKPLVNGVLRNFQRQREALLAQVDSEESVVFSHPEWLVGKLRKQWPEHYLRLLEQANQPPPFSLRVNRLRVDRDGYLELLAKAGMAARPCRFSASGVVLEQPVATHGLPGFADGWVSVQDEAAQLAAGLLDLRPGQRVLDLCAAPGGKTLHILETEPALASLTALDLAAERLAKINDNLQRAQLSATVLCGDAANPQGWWDGGQYERILLDAPCSATGVIRRHPDIKLLRRPEDITQLTHLQRRILDAAWSLLADGGLLVYATCSILKEENELQIARFLRDHPQAREVPIQAGWGHEGAAGRQILSGEDGMDGFYFACLAK